MFKTMTLAAMLLASIAAFALPDQVLPVGGSFYDGKTLQARKDSITTGTTDTSAYTPRFVGDVLLGLTDSTNSLWVAVGVTTGDWSLVSNSGGKFSAAELVAGTVAPAIDGSAITNNAAGNIASGNLALARMTNALVTGTLAANITGNIAAARMTNALPTLAALAVNDGTSVTGVVAASVTAANVGTVAAASATTNLFITAGGTTNIMILYPFGGSYVVKSITAQ